MIRPPISRHHIWPGDNTDVSIVLVGNGSVIRQDDLTVRLDPKQTLRIEGQCHKFLQKGHAQALLSELTSGAAPGPDIHIDGETMTALALDIRARSEFYAGTVAIARDTITVPVLPASPELVWGRRTRVPVGTFTLAAKRTDFGGVRVVWQLGKFGDSVDFQSNREYLAHCIEDKLAAADGGCLEIEFIDDSCLLSTPGATALVNWLRQP